MEPPKISAMIPTLVSSSEVREKSSRTASSLLYAATVLWPVTISSTVLFRLPRSIWRLR